MSDEETLQARVAALEAEVKELKHKLNQVLHLLVYGTSEDEWTDLDPPTPQE